jgi:uncharacterized protein YcfJ
VRIRPIVVNFAVFAALALPSTARAQYAATFEELPAATKAGQKLFVFDREGNEIRGRLAGVTADTVTLRVQHATRELTRDQITLIRTPAQDSVLNGAAIGAAVTGGFTLLSFAGCDTCTGAGALVLGGMLWGAGIGAIIDACILTPRDVYRVGKRHVDVQPVVTPSARGASIAVRW